MPLLPAEVFRRPDGLWACQIASMSNDGSAFFAASNALGEYRLNSIFPTFTTLKYSSLS